VATDFVSSIFQDYVIFTSKAKKLSCRGRYSGGVIVMIRKSLASFAERIQVETENTVVIKLHRNVFGSYKDVMFICSYVHPHDSEFWKTKQGVFGMEILEQCILDLQSVYDDFFLVLTGDFNARTACNNYSTNYDNEDFERLHLCTDSDLPRKSQDMQTNMFGNQLVELCNMFDCVILNGLYEYGFDDTCTFIGPSGSSTVDYFIASLDLFTSIDLISLVVDSLTESDHLPVAMKVTCENDILTDVHEKYHNKKVFSEKYIWDKDKEDYFLNALKSDGMQNRLMIATHALESDIDSALDGFVKWLKDASACMLRKIPTSKTNNSECFDKECGIANKQCRAKLNRFRTTRNEEDRLVFVSERKKYKRLLKTKQQGYRKQKTELLADKIADSTHFWKEVRSMGCGNAEQIGNSINTNEWLIHFKGVFQNQSNSTENCNIDVDLIEENEHALNKDISEEEVSKAIARLKLGKSCGIDDISAEMLKSGGTDVLMFLVKLFNAIFFSGTYPKEWSKAIIIPIHKKGDRENVDNYRGISLLSIMSKCYTTILNTRLYDWLEDNNMISDSQAGFRKGYSAVDQIFNLYAVVQNCMQRKGRK
jgi:hypothetical protein